MRAHHQTYQPRFLRTDDRWAWLQQKPDSRTCGVDLIELTHTEQRCLGKSALALWMELERERGWDARWIVRSLAWLAQRAGLTIVTAQRALSRLRACGMVETRRTWTDRALHGNLEYRVWGTFDVRDGIRRVLIPSDRFGRWSATAPVRGRPKKIWHSRKKIACTSIPVVERNQVLARKDDRRSATPSFDAPQDHLREKMIGTPIQGVEQDQVLTRKDDTALIIIIHKEKNKKTEPSFQQVEKNGTALRVGAVLSILGEESRMPKITEEELLRTLQATMDKPRPFEVRSFPDPNLYVPPLDELEYEPQTSPVLLEGMVPVYYASSVVQSYREAVRKVYGPNCSAMRAFAFGELQKSKFFPRLVACGKAFCERAVPLGPWAEWFLQRCKERGDKKPPPATVVFSVKLVEKWEGWFRSEWDGPAGMRATKASMKLRSEQLCRRNEAINHSRGFPRVIAATACNQPLWYAEMRERELAMGIEDPFARYPRKTSGAR